MHAPPPPPPKPHPEAHPKPHEAASQKKKDDKSSKPASLQDQIKARRPKDDELTVDPDLPTFDINLFACGSGKYGRLAQGPNNEANIAQFSRCRSYTPVQFAKIACGAGHTLAIDTQGHVWAWGKCHYGQLGHGQVWKDERLPKRVEALGDTIVLIGAGWSFSLAVSRENQIYAFGCGYFGALGNDSEETHAAPSPIALKIPPGIHIVRVCGGAYHAGAVLSDGSAFVWGANNHSQLGLGDQMNKKHPTPVSIIDNGKSLCIADMDMGESTTVFVTDCGKVFWCGAEHYKSPQREIPHLKDGSPAENVKIVRCECTAAGVLLLDADGYVYFTFELQRSPPARFNKWPGGKEPTFSMIACGENHALAVARNNSVYSWGRGAFYSTKISRAATPPSEPNIIEGDALKDLTPIAVDAGSNHSFVLVQN